MDRTFTQKKISTTTKNGKQHNLSQQQPSNEIISAILNYSKSLKINKSTFVNQVELVLN